MTTDLFNLDHFMPLNPADPLTIYSDQTWTAIQEKAPKYTAKYGASLYLLNPIAFTIVYNRG